jgi:hypothetical protein
MPGASRKQSEKGFGNDKIIMREKIRGHRRGVTHGIHLAQEDPLFPAVCFFLLEIGSTF